MRVRLWYLTQTMIVSCLMVLLCAVLWRSIRVETVLGQFNLVGANVCSSCHAEQAEAWAHSHHAASTTLPRPSDVAGRFDDQVFTDAGRRVIFSTQGDRLVIRVEEHDRSVRNYGVIYTIGLYPLQQYVVETEPGRLQAFDVAWDSRQREMGGQRWLALKPAGETFAGDPLHWTGRAFNWNGMCAPCHVTGLAKGYDLDANRFATVFSDINVACEACHGAGKAHVEWARSGAKADDPKKALSVDLSRARGQWGPFDRASGIRHWVGPPREPVTFDICVTCHARAEIVAPQAAGAPLLANRVPSLIEPDVFQADGQIEAEDFEVLSFLQSKMYRAGVICSDCHDAHSLAVKAQGNALCGRCHEPARFDTIGHTHHRDGTDGTQCMACHMPTRTYMGVHVRHDHGFRIPRPDLTATAGVTNACSTCHAGKDAAWAAAAIEVWTGHKPQPHFAEAFAAAWSDNSDAETKILAVAFDRGIAPVVRASALRQLNANRLDPDLFATAVKDPDGLVRFAALDALQDADPILKRRFAWPLLDDPLLAVRLRAARLLGFLLPRIAGPDASLLSARLEDWTRSQLASAELPESHLNVGALAMEQGHYIEAEKAFQTALRLDPRFVPALLNAAEAERALGRADDSLASLQSALAIAPDQPDVIYALALAHIRRGDFDAAREILSAALRHAPGDARLSYILALTLQREGRMQEAMDVLRSAQRAHPHDTEINKSLSSFDASGANEK